MQRGSSGERSPASGTEELPLGELLSRDTAKLRGPPKARRYQAARRKAPVAGLTALGTVKARLDVTMDDPQLCPVRWA